MNKTDIDQVNQYATNQLYKPSFVRIIWMCSVFNNNTLFTLIRSFTAWLSSSVELLNRHAHFVTRLQPSEPRLNIKTVLSWYGDSYVTAVLSLTWESPHLVRPSFLLRRPPGFLSTTAMSRLDRWHDKWVAWSLEGFFISCKVSCHRNT